MNRIFNIVHDELMFDREVSDFEIYGDVQPFTKEGFPIFVQWCKDNGVHYYGEVSENFFPATGLRQAQRAGLTKIILEDLS